MIDEHDTPADRNKTDLTHDITEAAARWLAIIGAKCIETEVAVGPKWIADVAAYWRPTRTEAVNHGLIPRAKSYPYGSADSRMLEYQESRRAHFEVYRALPPIITIAVEVKTTRADFRRDIAEKFSRDPVADLQVIAIPRMLMPVEEFPTNCWVLASE